MNNLILFNFGAFLFFQSVVISEIIDLKKNYDWYRKDQIMTSIMRIGGFNFMNAYNIICIINYNNL